MDVNQVATDLRNQFSGQSVLYVNDLAMVLGKSEKAISNLMARRGLPFTVKFIGRRRCVDIFQVAQWLASDSGIIKDAMVPTVKPTALPPKQGPLKRPYTQMEIAILQSRQSNAASLARFADGLADPSEKFFIHDVARKIAFTDSRPSSIVLTCKSRDHAGESGEVWNEQKSYLVSVLSAESHMASFRNQSNHAFAVSIVLRLGRVVLFDACSLAGIWVVKVNRAKFNF